MRSRILPGVLLAGVLGAVTLGQHAPVPRGSADDGPPATMPGLPQGHPKMGMPPGMAGHGMGGHGMGGMGATSKPKSHPEVAGAKVGAIRVLVKQGTKNGPAIGKDDVTIGLLSRGKLLKTYTAAVGEKGVVEVRDIPLNPAFQPVITVKHAGVAQQLVGPTMSPYLAAVELDMPVYELASAMPAWNIPMRKLTLLVQKSEQGVVALRVIEMLATKNPTDRAWAGPSSGDAERETLRVVLPDGASDVVFGQGLLEAGAVVRNGAVSKPGVLLPGMAVHRFLYTLPVKDGKATVKIHAPADTSLLAVDVPEGAQVVRKELLAPKATSGHDEVHARMYSGKGLKAGQVAVLELANIAPPVEEKLPEGPNGLLDRVLPGPATQKK